MWYVRDVLYAVLSEFEAILRGKTFIISYD